MKPFFLTILIGILLSSPVIAEEDQGSALIKKAEEEYMAHHSTASEALYRKAIEYFTKTEGPSGKTLGDCYLGLGVNLKKQQKFAAAIAAIEKGVSIEDQGQDNFWQTNIGDCYVGLKKYDRAIQIYREILSKGGSDSLLKFMTYERIANACEAAGRLNDAEKTLREALAYLKSDTTDTGFQKVISPSGTQQRDASMGVPVAVDDYYVAMSKLATVLVQEQKYSDAELICQTVSPIVEEWMPYRRVLFYKQHALVLQKLNRSTEAVALLKKASRLERESQVVHPRPDLGPPPDP